VDEAFSMLESKVKDTSTLQDIREVLDVVGKAETMLDEMEAMLDSTENSEDLKDFWDDLDSLGKYIEPRFENVINYVEGNESKLNLSADDKALMEDLLSFEGEDRGGDRLNDAYNEDVASILNGNYELDEDTINELIQMITSTVMDSLSQYIDEDLADQIMGNILANLEYFKAEKFGDDFANDLLNNGNTVFAQMSGIDFENVEGSSGDDLEDLYEEFKALPIPEEELAGEAADYWEAVANTVSADPSNSEVETLVEEGQALLDELVQSQYENNLALKDVPGYFDEDFENVWYAEAVMEGLGSEWEGRKDAGGNLTYEYDPSGITLRAEALKVVLAAFGYTESGSGSDWWTGWENRGNELGLSLVREDLSQPASRGEMFRLIFEVADLSEDTYQGYFPDVDVLADYAPVEALYGEGLVTGTGDAGLADLEGRLNRAEVAALVQRAIDWQEEEAFLTDDIFSYGDSDFDFGDFLARVANFFKDILPANLF